MRILTFIALTLGLAVSAMAQVNVQQPPGTYTNNSVMIRDGTGNKVKNTANLTYVTEDSALNLFQLNGSYGGTGVNFVMGRTEEAFRINSSSAVTNLRTVDGAALRFSPSAGEVMELSYNSGTGAKLVEVTGDITISGGISADGVNDLPGSVIRAPATITITEANPDTGPIAINNAYNQATIDEATTFTPSAAGTEGTFITLDVTNSGGSAYTMTVDTATDFTFTAQASGVTTVIMRSNGTGWVLVGGDPSVIGLSANTAPASTSLVAITNPTTGVVEKTSVAQILTNEISRLGSHTTPDTTAGSITWTSNLYMVYSNTTTTYALPAASTYANRGVIFYVTGTNLVTIDPNASEVIVRAGTVQTGGVTMTLTGLAGNYVCLISDGVRWVTYGYVGTLAAGS